MRALFDGGLGQTHENGFRQRTVRDIDFHFDRDGVDPDQGKGPQFREHAPRRSDSYQWM
jgi:hypothetical protein